MASGSLRRHRADARRTSEDLTQRVNVLDAQVVATIRVDDPEYDAKFLAAMSTARERRLVPGNAGTGRTIAVEHRGEVRLCPVVVTRLESQPRAPS
jgi:hypothetical protein